MGGQVSSFFSDLGNGLTTLWEETQREFIRPVLGDSISEALGVLKPRTPGMADGGMVLDGQKGVKVIDTPAQLIALIKKYPEEAMANGLSVEMVKQEAKKMAHGGMVKDRPMPSLLENPAQHIKAHYMKKYGGAVYRPGQPPSVF
jgi:hypothetical protein